MADANPLPFDAPVPGCQFVPLNEKSQLPVKGVDHKIKEGIGKIRQSEKISTEELKAGGRRKEVSKVRARIAVKLVKKYGIALAEVAIQLSDRKLTLNPRYCWTDVWAFERIIRQAESAWNLGMEKNDMTEAVSMVQKGRGMFSTKS